MSFDLALINGDLKIESNGSIKTVTDTQKLRQDLIKIVLTPLGANKNHTWYGCSLIDSFTGNFNQQLLNEAKIKTSILQSLDRIKALQFSQSTYQKVSLAELIDKIKDITVERDLDDPRKLNVVVSITSKRLTNIEELFTVIL